MLTRSDPRRRVPRTALALAVLLLAGLVAGVVAAALRKEPNPIGSKPTISGLLETRRDGVVPASPWSRPTSKRYVDPSGSDRGPGSAEDPWRTLEHSLEAIEPGQRLVVGSGTYSERLTTLRITSGTSRRPIQVVAAPGAHPVLKGLLWLRDADYWAFSGLDVQWSRRNDRDQHMVKFDGGTGWSFSHAEVSGAKGFSAVLVTGRPRAWTLSHLFVHGTRTTHDKNQDHLIYVSARGTGGLIQRCLLVDSPNGRGIKVGPPDDSTAAVGDLVIRYNTFYKNLGPSNIQLSRGASGNVIYRNIFARSGDGSPSVSAFELTGGDNVVFNNVFTDSTGIITRREAGLVDGGGNVHRDPRFADSGQDDFHPADAVASRYGRYASRSR